MSSVHVALGRRSYEIDIGHGQLQTDALRSIVNDRRCLIVTDDHVAAHWLEAARRALPAADTLVLPAGEANKTLSSVSDVIDHLADHGYARDSVIVALGGGVIGDMAGFAAATYHRGIDFVQVPTTLLSMVDSSVGGKTGVNHTAGKNLIGAFHQPIHVLIDLATLSTLPEREYLAGVAEVVKYALLGDSEFLAWLEEHADELLAQDADVLGETVARCCSAKADIVAADEREAGQRALLNLGHTFGHAIENAMGYGTWLHGEAVAAGMQMAAEFSAMLGLLSQNDVDRCRNLLQRLGLPTDPPNMAAEQFLVLMGRDKKVKAGTIRLVLLQALGHAFLTADHSGDELAQYLKTRLGR